MKPAAFFISILALLLVQPGPPTSTVKRTNGQTVYVQAYSHIYHGNKWKTDTEVNQPIIESVMIGASGQQGGGIRLTRTGDRGASVFGVAGQAVFRLDLILSISTKTENAIAK